MKRKELPKVFEKLAKLEKLKISYGLAITSIEMNFNIAEIIQCWHISNQQQF